MALAPVPDQDETQDQERAERELRERVSGLVDRLQAEADDRVTRRDPTEKIWLEDLRMYHAKYDPGVEAKLKGKSKAFFALTRAKTDACEARLSDMLFPADDKPYAVQPTPVPELTTSAQSEADNVEQLVAQTNEHIANQNPEGAQQALQQAKTSADAIAANRKTMDVAKLRAQLMEAEIEDQLTEARFAKECRDMIRDACQIGAGVLKGPMVATNGARKWRQRPNQPDQMPEGHPQRGAIYELYTEEDPRPMVYRVDYWNFFPDPDASTIEECEGFYERHLLNAKQMRNLARQPGFDADEIRDVLRDDPKATMPTYLTDLRSISDQTADQAIKRYEVWEYNGPIKPEEMRDLCECMGKDQMMAGVLDDEGEIDPLIELNVVIWFCQGRVLKFGIGVMDSGDPIYSVYTISKDAASIWGSGIPRIMRQSQKVLNAAWRMMMDNGGLSSGPQIVINRKYVTPSDGVWDLRARKIWFEEDMTPPGMNPFKTFNIEMHQAELANIIQIAKQFVDEETGISVLAQGEQGTHTTQTAQGMTLLMNATNVIFRRMVKNFDDDVIEPVITRMYHWNMQFSSKEVIKGDFQVDARGSSVLLVREMQAQNLMAIAVQFSGHPVLGLLIKTPQIVRKLFQSMMIPADDIVKSDDELKQEAADRAKQMQDQPNPDQTKERIQQMRSDTDLQKAQLQHETAMMTLAEQRNMSVEEINAMLEKTRMETSHKERQFAAEAAVETKRQRDAEARGFPPPSSGGGSL